MRKLTTRGFRVTRSPRLREAVIDGRIRSEHRLYYLWTAGSEEPEASGDGPIQNGPRRLKRIKALHWQTPARGSFDPQRLSGALANRLAPRRATAIQRLGHRRAPGR